MNSGKVSNSILNRSVLKLIKKDKNIIVNGLGIGLDSTVINIKSVCSDNIGKLAVATSNSVYSVYRAVNNLLVNGANPIGIMNNIIMPNDFDERELKASIRKIQSQCEVMKVSICGGHTEVLEAVNKPVLTVTAFGTVADNIDISAKNAKPNQDIIMTKCIGIEGVRLIAAKKQSEILKKYSQEVIDKAVGLESEMSIAPEAILARNNGINAMHDVSDGGIFAALWDMAEAAKVGLDIEFKNILVRQEIIEICEMFDINPYELMSSGCLLMTSDNGCDIVKILKENGIASSIIGRTTAANDRIIHNEDENRFLEPPKRDEVYRI